MIHTRYRPMIAGVAAGGLLALAGAALAQTTGPAAAQRPAATAPGPAAAAAPNGPNIPGVCVYNNAAAMGGSAVGKYVNTRMGQLQAQAQAELNAEKTAIETDARALDGQKATLSQDVLQQRTLTLQQRAGALQRKADQRSRELELTEQKAVSRIVTEINPLLRQVYVQHQCSLLLDGNSVFGSNPNMDVTGDVVRLLDAKLTQFPFDRERLDQQAAAAAPAAAAQPRAGQ